MCEYFGYGWICLSVFDFFQYVIGNISLNSLMFFLYSLKPAEHIISAFMVHFSKSTLLSGSRDEGSTYPSCSSCRSCRWGLPPCRSHTSPWPRHHPSCENQGHTCLDNTLNHVYLQLNKYCTVHTTYIRTIHSTLYTTNWTSNTVLDCTVILLYCIVLYSNTVILYCIVQGILYTVNFTLYTLPCTVHTKSWKATIPNPNWKHRI